MIVLCIKLDSVIFVPVYHNDEIVRYDTYLYSFDYPSQLFLASTAEKPGIEKGDSVLILLPAWKQSDHVVYPVFIDRTLKCQNETNFSKQ